MAGPVKRYLWKQKIHRGIARHSDRWKILVDGEFWLCPFCAKVGFRCDPARALQDQILDHLANDCAEWKEGKGKPQLAATLKEQAERSSLRIRLQRQAAWRLFDFENRWYCPYCAQPTEVTRPMGDRPTEEMVDRVGAHLRSCDLAKKTGAKEIPLETLRETVQQHNRFRSQVAAVRSQMESLEMWRLFDATGGWVCPFCACVVEEVRVAELALLLSVAPPLMTQHLQKHCPEFGKNPQPARSLEEMKSLVRDINEGRRPRGTVRELEDNLASARAQIQSTATELDRARDVQRSILPLKTPDLPGYQVACRYEPAAQLGGDFYAFITVDEAHLGLLMADVSGHGADAALLMSMTKKAFDLRGPGTLSPLQVLRFIHRDIVPDLRGQYFITVFYGVLDYQRHALQFGRAGHNLPLLYNARRECDVALLKSRGMAIGLGAEEDFEKNMEECTLKLQSGDLLLLYTDGLVEAKNRQGEEFKLARVSEIVRRMGQGSLDALLQALIRAVTDYAEGQAQEDDIALMAVRYVGGQS
ncbi:MAG: PP2C family protein-serine/threonine phosphatase [Planctomycetes bacterium]|nr:PP2C family protein-serine/threonine phosphatase [Planctomycetota bacterium]